MSTTAVADNAREHARRADGRFGQQQAGEGDIADLTVFAAGIDDDVISIRRADNNARAMNDRLDTMLPGDAFTLDVAGDLMRIEYDEVFDEQTGATSHQLHLTANKSETTLVADNHNDLYWNLGVRIFESDAWRDRYTATNAHNAGLAAGRAYDRELATAIAYSVPTVDEFHAELTSARTDPEAYAEFRREHQATIAAFADYRHAHNRHYADSPVVELSEVPRTLLIKELIRNAESRYLYLAEQDLARQDAADELYRTELTEWQQKTQAREKSAWRRLAPAPEKPTPETVRRRVDPHPFGGMTREDWINHERELIGVGPDPEPGAELDHWDDTTRRASR